MKIGIRGSGFGIGENVSRGYTFDTGVLKLLALPFACEARKGELEGDSSRIPNPAPRTPIHQSGFTLIELIVVITVLGILSLISMAFIRYTVKGYARQTDRAALVDDTTLALSRMARDIRAALPNSILVSNGGKTIEMIHVVASARYRGGPGPNHSGDEAILKFNKADDQFNVMPVISLPAGTRAVIYNIGINGADAWQNANVITPVGTTVTPSGDNDETRITLSPGFQFKYRSPARRIYFVDGAVAWTCDNNKLTRFSGYGIDQARANGAQASGDVAACNFQYQAGTTQRAGVATLNLTLTRQGESVHLLEQVHVVNAP